MVFLGFFIFWVWHGKWEDRPTDKLWKHSLNSCETQLLQPNYQSLRGAQVPSAWHADASRVSSPSALRHLIHQMPSALSNNASVKFGDDKISNSACSRSLCCSRPQHWCAFTFVWWEFQRWTGQQWDRHTQLLSGFFGAAVFLSNACCFTVNTLFLLNLAKPVQGGNSMLPHSFWCAPSHKFYYKFTFPQHQQQRLGHLTTSVSFTPIWTSLKKILACVCLRMHTKHLCDSLFTPKHLQICGKTYSHLMSLWTPLWKFSTHMQTPLIYLFIWKSALVPQSLPVRWSERQPSTPLRSPPAAQCDEGVRNNSSLCSVWRGASTWQPERGCRAHGGERAATEVHWHGSPLTRLPSSNSRKDELAQSLRWDMKPFFLSSWCRLIRKAPCCHHVMRTISSYYSRKTDYAVAFY